MKKIYGEFLFKKNRKNKKIYCLDLDLLFLSRDDNYTLDVSSG